MGQRNRIVKKRLFLERRLGVKHFVLEARIVTTGSRAAFWTHAVCDLSTGQGLHVPSHCSRPRCCAASLPGVPRDGVTVGPGCFLCKIRVLYKVVLP